MSTIEKTKTYICKKCDKTWLLEWVRGSVTNATLFPLHREAPNHGLGHIHNDCGGHVELEA